eukprot:750696-Hanusia_phi.AAC.1
MLPHWSIHTGTSARVLSEIVERPGVGSTSSKGYPIPLTFLYSTTIRCGLTGNLLLGSMSGKGGWLQVEMGST